MLYIWIYPRSIQSILKHQNVKVNLGTSGGAADIEDKLDLLMDANDQILERAVSNAELKKKLDSRKNCCNNPKIWRYGITLK